MQEQNSSISNFRRFLVWVLLPFLFIVAMAGIIIDSMFTHQVILRSQMVGAYKVNRIIRETHAAEIPIFGSSRAEGSFIPDSLGPHFFNYGLSGTMYDVTLFFLEEECRKKKNEPWIILNLDLEGLNYSLGDIANYIPNSDNSEVKELLGDKYNPYYKIPLVRYYGLYESYFRDFLNNKMQLTKVAGKGAAIEKKALTEAQFNELVEQRKASETIFHTDSMLLQKMNRIIAAHPERHFVFVISPYHGSYFQRYSNMRDAETFLAQLGSRQNVKVFNFSKMPLADSMFFNTSHLNYRGACVFSSQLRDSLRSLGIR